MYQTTLKQYLDLGSPFVGVETADVCGQTPLLHLLNSSDVLNYEYLAMMEVLINRGANIQATDLEGNSCLHEALKKIHQLGAHQWRTVNDTLNQDILLLLVKHGADVLAKTLTGESVSDAAHFERNSIYCAPDTSFVRDLWDSVLAISGYDLTDFHKIHMKGYSRVGRYCVCYTRSEFENLWKGNEHLCPYYHDGLEEHIRCQMEARSMQIDLWSSEDEDLDYEDHSGKSECSDDEEEDDQYCASDRETWPDISPEPGVVGGGDFVSSSPPDDEATDRETPTTPDPTGDVKMEDDADDTQNLEALGNVTGRVTYDWNAELQENPWG